MPRSLRSQASRHVWSRFAFDVRQTKRRPDDAPLFLVELSKELSELEHRSDILALGYVTEIYHIAATYALTGLSKPIEDAFEKIYERDQKVAPLRLHCLISMLSRFLKYASNMEPELEELVDRLNLPNLTKLSMRVLKMSTEALRKEFGNEKLA